jgi:hypothetical protein
VSTTRRRRAGARARLAIAGAVAVSLAVAGVALVGSEADPPALQPRAAERRPVLLLLTSLPLVFGESFSLEGGGSPALAALETRYRVVPVNTADAQSLKAGKLLLMAHPLAQPAEVLVELDAWVRAGGRLLLLADPMLEWESERPLGDPFRPPPAFADTGLLRHWGLKLDAPDERGPRQLELAGHAVLTSSPGALSGRCAIGKAGLVARCRVGKGEATIVADADFLNVEGPGTLDGPTQHNLAALLAELARIEKP